MPMLPLDGYIPTTGALVALERITGGVGHVSETRVERDGTVWNR